MVDSKSSGDAKTSDTGKKDTATADGKASDTTGDAKSDANADAKSDGSSDTADVDPNCNNDGVCGANEDPSSCPADCPCNYDGVCDPGETIVDCAGDCPPGPCNNDGTCDPDESNAGGCTSDCPCNKDGKCEGEENKANCPEDCVPAVCGNGKCETSESPATCPQDCKPKPVCGNGKCEAGETVDSCAEDCTGQPVCGDGTCDAPGETCTTCEKDCGTCGCNPLTSDGCASNEQCYPQTATDSVCGAAGSFGKGEACGADTDCQKGLLCVGDQCRPLCGTDGSSPCTSAATACLPVKDPAGKPVTWPIGVCLGGDLCNLVNNAGCATGQGCMAVSAVTKACMATGGKTEGQPCQSAWDCASTLYCVVKGDGGVCKKRCNAKTNSPGCPNNGTCSAVMVGTSKAADNLGTCP
jgi:hypothetical protein